MPDVTQQIVKMLALRPGDIIITEAPYEDAVEDDFTAVTNNNLDNFNATHISIYTGDFIKPFAHSVREGFKLPGVRLTGVWDGRHIVYRFKNQELSARFAEVSRRWALAATMYDENKFDAVYPKRFWSDQYDVYRHQFFSIPNAIVAGPATPYNLERASKQISDSMRNTKLKIFNRASMLRAIKFASRSELFQTVSNGLRCTSFVVSAIQAATLQPVVLQCNIKFSFKSFRNGEVNDLASKLLIKNWQDTPVGAALYDACRTRDFTNFFPEGLCIDSKYAIPEDLFKSLKDANDWRSPGSFVCFKDQLLFCNTLDQAKTKKVGFKTYSKSNIVKHNYKYGIKNNSKSELIAALNKKNEENKHLLEQLDQEKNQFDRIVRFGTPLRNQSSTLLRRTSGPAEQQRRLSFN